MTRSSSKEVIEYNPELEKTLRLLKKELAERVSQQPQGFNTVGDINAGNRGLNDPVNPDTLNRGLGIENEAENPGVVNRRIHRLPVEVEDQMDQNNGRAGRLLGDYAKINYNGMQSSVRCPPVAANNFEIKHSVLQAIQNNCVFRGKQNEDPTYHLMDFDEIMNIFHYNGASDDAIYLRAFPFSLKDDAKIWLRSLPVGSIRTWNEMTTKFLDKYFSPAKTARMRKEISNFSQLESETVFEAWEIFKELLRKCPHNGIEPWLQLTNFWEGLSPASRRILNNAVGGPIMKKTVEEAIEILDELAEDANQWVVENYERKKSAGVHQVDTYTTLQAQIASIAKEVKQLTLAQAQMTQSIICDFCVGGHPTHECQQVPLAEEEVNVVGNYNRGNNFNAMGLKHPGFSWSAPNGSLNTWQ
ncbi:hypothetical protein KY289_030399 [Solanum tuberosum]|nr:hypothetical protein KY289_030399 [Solanum tuberosum]